MAVITFGVIFHGDAIKPNMCLLVQYSHQRETKMHGFNHYYQYHTMKYIAAIALINNKKSIHYINLAVSPP